jgi:hypothetical protein
MYADLAQTKRPFLRVRHNQCKDTWHSHNEPTGGDYPANTNKDHSYAVFESPGKEPAHHGRLRFRRLRQFPRVHNPGQSHHSRPRNTGEPKEAGACIRSFSGPSRCSSGQRVGRSFHSPIRCRWAPPTWRGNELGQLGRPSRKPPDNCVSLAGLAARSVKSRKPHTTDNDYGPRTSHRSNSAAMIFKLPSTATTSLSWCPAIKYGKIAKWMYEGGRVRAR